MCTPHRPAIDCLSLSLWSFSNTSRYVGGTESWWSSRLRWRRSCVWTTPSGWEGGLDKVAVSGSVELAKGLRLVFWTESRLGLAFTGRGKHTATESNEDTDREVHMYVCGQTHRHPQTNRTGTSRLLHCVRIYYVCTYVRMSIGMCTYV